jgi:hypothetical protein
MPSAITARTRRDGWTTARQIDFLTALARDGCVTSAAASVRMSRESAYRLRARDSGGLFTALWDKGLAPATPSEVHERDLGDGVLLRLLGNGCRRKTNELGVVTQSDRSHGCSDRTRTL